MVLERCGQRQRTCITTPSSTHHENCDQIYDHRHFVRTNDLLGSCCTGLKLFSSSRFCMRTTLCHQTQKKMRTQPQNWMNLTQMSGNGTDGKTKTEPNTSHMTWNILHTCTQTPSHVWANIFHLFRFSASRKLHFSVCPVCYGSLFFPLPLLPEHEACEI